MIRQQRLMGNILTSPLMSRSWISRRNPKPVRTRRRQLNQRSIKVILELPQGLCSTLTLKCNPLYLRCRALPPPFRSLTMCPPIRSSSSTTRSSLRATNKSSINFGRLPPNLASGSALCLVLASETLLDQQYVALRTMALSVKPTACSTRVL